MAPPRIARAGPEDAGRLAALAAAALDGTGRHWDADALRTFGTLPRGLLLADADRRAGLLILGLAPGEAEILELAVVPAARRAGLGRALLAAAAAEATAADAERIFLEVAEDNTPARALYAAAGYVPVGRRSGYYARAGAPRADALLLARPLAGARATG